MEQPVLLNSVQVIDPEGPWHNQVVDVLLQNGQIVDIGHSIKAPDALILKSEGSMISPGWIDGQAHFREPGFETKEGMRSGLNAASRGGFTQVAVLPSTSPRVDQASAVRNVLALAQEAQSDGTPAEALALACLSEKGFGEQLAEMHDMSEAGAVAFTDDSPLDRVSLLQRALTYSKVHGKVVVDVPLDRDMNAGGLMHEGVVSTQMGVIGIPHEAETLRVSRDLDVLKYTEGRLHFAILTCADSVKMVREAKRSGLKVTCGTTAAHLMFCDEDLDGFVGALRVCPPFRSAADREALRQGVLDGTIDMVVSDHRPEDLENHDVEFMLSPNGMATLPSAFSLALSGLTESAPDSLAAIEALINALNRGPRAVFSMTPSHLESGQACNLTWFHPNMKHSSHGGTKGVNVPPQIEGQKGQILGVFMSDRSWQA